MVPVKYGPNIKLKSLKIFCSIPPLTFHNLNGIENILKINTNKDEKVPTEVYFLMDSFGKKKRVSHDKINNPIRIMVGNRYLFNINSPLRLCYEYYFTFFEFHTVAN